jgi:hypothetical protein
MAIQEIKVTQQVVEKIMVICDICNEGEEIGGLSSSEWGWITGIPSRYAENYQAHHRCIKAMIVGRNNSGTNKKAVDK